MDKSISAGIEKRVRQRYFAARELRVTIAVLVVLALLGGAFLQSISVSLSTYFGFTTPFLSIFLTIGYIIITAVLAVSFAHRFLGPFKRLEYEMKIITSGELDKRLTIKARDDLYVRNFVAYVNKFIENFENMSKDYNKLHSAISIQMDDIINKIERGRHDPEDVKKTLKILQEHVHEMREKW